MSGTGPRFLLTVDSQARSTDGTWSFVLRTEEGRELLAVRCDEPETSVSRLALLAVIRALESLDQPSSVALSTGCRYLAHGIGVALDDWRASGWMWESYGGMAPIKHRDLWQRLDRALRFHRVVCEYRPALREVASKPIRAAEARTWRIDRPHAVARSGKPRAAARANGSLPTHPPSEAPSTPLAPKLTTTATTHRPPTDRIGTSAASNSTSSAAVAVRCSSRRERSQAKRVFDILKVLVQDKLLNSLAIRSWTLRRSRSTRQHDSRPQTLLSS